MSSNRTLATALGVIAAVLLFYLVNPWFSPEADSTLNQIVTVGFWISFIALLVVLFQMRKEPGGETVEIEEPAFTRFLFSNTRPACSGSDPPVRRLRLARGRLAQVQRQRLDRRGTALLGYWTTPSRSRRPGGQPAITYDWYRSFLQPLIDNNAYVWFAPSSPSASSRSGSASSSAS